LTSAPRIKPTSIFRRSARRPNPGRGSTYRRGESVQTTGTSSQLAPIRRGWDRRNGLRGERRVDKLPNGPSPVHHAQRLRWGRLEGFMNAAKVVVRDVQRDRRDVVVQLL
jgi:hypothetical protein